jgi:hypothetical protein
MPVFNKKERMVSFRLSRAEYAAAEISCTRNGVRSVSSLARDAVLNLSAAAPRPHGPADLEILLQLQHQILTLRAEVDRLTSVVAVNQPNLRLAAESTQ